MDVPQLDESPTARQPVQTTTHQGEPGDNGAPGDDADLEDSALPLVLRTSHRGPGPLPPPAPSRTRALGTEVGAAVEASETEDHATMADDGRVHLDGEAKDRGHPGANPTDALTTGTGTSGRRGQNGDGETGTTIVTGGETTDLGIATGAVSTTVRARGERTRAEEKEARRARARRVAGRPNSTIPLRIEAGASGGDPPGWERKGAWRHAAPDGACRSRWAVRSRLCRGGPPATSRVEAASCSAA